MGFCFGDKNSGKTDRQIIESNASALDVCITIADGNAEIVGELKELKELLKYLVPSEIKEVISLDGRIGDKVSDLKLELSKVKNDEYSRVKDAIKDIRVAVAERNAKA